MNTVLKILLLTVASLAAIAIVVVALLVFLAWRRRQRGRRMAREYWLSVASQQPQRTPAELPTTRFAKPAGLPQVRRPACAAASPATTPEPPSVPSDAATPPPSLAAASVSVDPKNVHQLLLWPDIYLATASRS